jgi:hypothetical protein
MSLTSLLLVSLTAGSIFTYNVVIITFLAQLFINNFIEGSRYKEKGRTTTGDMARGEITGDPVPAVLATVLIASFSAFNLFRLYGGGRGGCKGSSPARNGATW